MAARRRIYRPVFLVCARLQSAVPHFAFLAHVIWSSDFSVASAATLSHRSAPSRSSNVHQSTPRFPQLPIFRVPLQMPPRLWCHTEMFESSLSPGAPMSSLVRLKQLPRQFAGGLHLKFALQLCEPPCRYPSRVRQEVRVNELEVERKCVADHLKHQPTNF